MYVSIVPFEFLNLIFTACTKENIADEIICRLKGTGEQTDIHFPLLENHLKNWRQEVLKILVHEQAGITMLHAPVKGHTKGIQTPKRVFVKINCDITC